MVAVCVPAAKDPLWPKALAAGSVQTLSNIPTMNDASRLIDVDIMNTV